MNEWPGGWADPARPDPARPDPARPDPAGDPDQTMMLPPELSPRRGAAAAGGTRDGALGDTASFPPVAAQPTEPARTPPRRPGGPVVPAPLPPPPSRRRRRGWRLARRLLALLLVIVIGFYAALAGWVATHLRKIDALPAATGRPADAPGRNWLVVGSDSRAGLTAAEQHKLSTGSIAGQRTDTIMLVHLPASGKPTLVSLPRDSYVAIPGRGRNKLNAAYAFGGAPLLVRTVERATGLRVDNFAEVGFAGIVGLTDAVGGVRQCIPKAIKDAKSGLNVRAGCQQLDGPTALAYVRARYFDPLGDLGRIQRQQKYLAALTHEVATPRTLVDPFRLVHIAQAGTGAVTLDKGSGVLDLISLARAMRSISGGDGVSTTVPISDPDYRVGGQSTVRWDDRKARALFASLRH